MVPEGHLSLCHRDGSAGGQGRLLPASAPCLCEQMQTCLHAGGALQRGLPRRPLDEGPQGWAFSSLHIFSEFVRAAVTKHHSLGGSNDRYLLSHDSVNWRPKIKVSAGLFLPRPLSWDVDGRLLPVSPHGHPSVCVCVISSSHKDTCHIGLGPPL